MSDKPVLILQMQRLGDLVLSFPLLGWLLAENPDRPLLVVGEERFFQPLLSLSPLAAYFSYACAPDLKNHAFSAVINLSHRPEAAAMAGKAKTEALYGPWLDSQGRLFISGDWQLYRASLTHNNRYNRFHWADLNALDTIKRAAFKFSRWSAPGAPEGTAADKREKRIGLFLGASEPDKHPGPAFWAKLAALLLQRGHRPVFLGGPAEKKLGHEAARLLGAHALNLTGRFNISELAHFLSELDLFVTPDTGPMHIAAWTGTPVLNLSMGPVNPWETGPSSPGHHVLRPDLPCAGCWQCVHERPICKELFTPEKVTVVIARLLSSGGKGPIRRSGADGLELLRTGRDARGLYHLESLDTARPEREGAKDARNAVSRFWQAWFAAAFGLYQAEDTHKAASALAAAHPEEYEQLRDAALTCLADTARQTRAGQTLWPDDHWRNAPPTLQPFTGYLQMYAQNASGSKQALRRCLELAENLTQVLLTERITNVK